MTLASRTIRILLLASATLAGGLGAVGLVRGAEALVPVPPWAWDPSGDHPSPSPPGSLHLVLQSGDCPETVDFLAALAQRAREAGLSVSGTLLGSRRSRATFSLLRGESGFPVNLEPDRWGLVNRRLRSLGFRRTPALFMVDRRNRIVASLPGEPTARSTTPALETTPTV